MKLNKYLVFFLILISLTFFNGQILAEEVSPPAFSPPESRLVDTHDMTMAGIDIHSFLYSTSLTREAVIGYYQDYLAKQGFRLNIDTQDKFRRLLRFQKNTFVLNIALLPPTEETKVAVTYYIQPQGKPSPEKGILSWEEMVSFAFPPVGSADNTGKDLDYVPRPPQSTRLFSVIMPNSSHLGYISTYTVSDLRTFYNKNMLPLGWEAKDEISMGDTIKRYKETIGKKIISPSPGINLEQIVQGGVILNYEGYDGAVSISLINNRYSEKNKVNSIILIRYGKK